MEINQIILGNAYELIKQVPDKSVDLIVTDPPYDFGTGGFGTASDGKWYSRQYGKDVSHENLRCGIDLSILDEFVRVMKKGNIYIWCNKEQILDYMKHFVDKMGWNFEILIWAKTNPTPFHGNGYLHDKEYCLFFWERGASASCDIERAKTAYFTPTNVSDKKEYDHPTIKPEPIIENLILNSCKRGGLVLDPFSGSGTTCAVAKRLGMNYLGFEIDQRFHEISCDRLQGITPFEKKNKAKQLTLF